jgi:hypothetical protein
VNKISAAFAQYRFQTTVGDLLFQIILDVKCHLSLNQHILQQLHAYLILIYLEGLVTTMCNIQTTQQESDILGIFNPLAPELSLKF